MSIRIYGNRELKTLPGLETRPTPARVRQALFNVWQGSISGCRWLDLCSGSGAMGAEALCRDAQLVVGIERSAAAGDIIEHNWRKVASKSQQFQLLRGLLTLISDLLRDLPIHLRSWTTFPSTPVDSFYAFNSS